MLWALGSGLRISDPGIVEIMGHFCSCHSDGIELGYRTCMLDIVDHSRIRVRRFYEYRLEFRRNSALDQSWHDLLETVGHPAG